MNKQPAKVAVEARPPKLNQTLFRLHGFTSQNYVATPTYGVTLEQVLDESYWAHVARELKAGYTIDVQPEGLPWYAKLIVIDAGPAHAKVKVLHFVDLTNEAQTPQTPAMPMTADAGPKFEIDRAGRWFRVVRKSDKELMKGGFDRIEKAQAWARENLNTTEA